MQTSNRGRKSQPTDLAGAEPGLLLTGNMGSVPKAICRGTSSWHLLSPESAQEAARGWANRTVRSLWNLTPQVVPHHFYNIPRIKQNNNKEHSQEGCFAGHCRSGHGDQEGGLIPHSSDPGGACVMVMQRSMLQLTFESRMWVKKICFLNTQWEFANECHHLLA